MHNQLSARVDSQISSSWAYTGFAKVDQLFLFSGGGAYDAWRSHAFARGACFPEKIFGNGAFWSIFS